MALSLANVTLVVSGEFEGLDAEDIHWDLVALGAFVKKSVTKTTGAVIVGDKPKANHLKGAEKHGTPLLNQAGLQRLLAGESLDAVLSGAADTTSDTLKGWKVAVAGSFPGRTKSAVTTTLEGLGAKVVTRASNSCDLLVLGEDYGIDAIEAQDSGVPFIYAEQLDALRAGTPISDFVGPAGPHGKDAKNRAELLLDQLLPTLVESDSGEAWDDELKLTVNADGRPILELRDMGGTPLHDRARQIVQRQSWPTGQSEFTITRSVTWK